MRIRILIVLTAALAAAGASAQQYRWIDENGGVHYSDTPPPSSAKSAQKKNLNGNAVGSQTNYALSQAMKSSPVTLYSHPDCRETCQVARDVLNQRGVPFAEVSTTDSRKIDELRRVSGGATVPVLVVGAQVQTAASIDAYNEALDLAGYPKLGVLKARSQSAPPRPAQMEVEVR
jgi:glutaredoxin